MTKKWEETSKQKLVRGIQDQFKEAGIPVDLSKIDPREMRGADDLDLVYTGLDNIMSSALEETLKTAEQEKISLRIAAYLNAIKRIHVHYDKVGFTI